MERKLCYDSLMDSLFGDQRKEITSKNKRFLSREKSDLAEEGYSRMERLLQDSKIFWIDKMTLDSLANFPFSPEGIQSFDYKLPFPTMFLELEGGMTYKTIKPNKFYESYTVNGISIDTVHSPTFNSKYIELRAFGKNNPTEIVDVNYSGHKENKDDRILIQEMCVNEVFEPKGLSRITFDCYAYDPNTKEIAVITDDSLARGGGEIVDIKLEDTDNLNALKLANLGVNVIQYINAQNVIYNEVKRKEKKKIFQSFKTGPKSNRITRKKEVEVEMPMKPYYWVEIKKEEKRVDKREGDSDHYLTCRFWVRGHNRYYKDDTGNVKYHRWIEPHVKGPEDAPFKNNRYEVLYKRFKPLLDNPNLRGGPWSFGDLNKGIAEARR